MLLSAILCELKVYACDDFIAFHIIVISGFTYREACNILGECIPDAVNHFFCEVVCRKGGFLKRGVTAHLNGDAVFFAPKLYDVLREGEKTASAKVSAT